MKEDKRNIIRIRDLSFSYDSTPILSDVNLDIMEGDSICIVGPNGGGKSTLIKLILGLLTPNKGSVQVYDKTPDQSRLRIGYVPQYVHFDPLFPVSVIDVVKMGRLGCSPSFFYRRRDHDSAIEALEAMNLAQLARQRFSALSGGQRQRVLIARALATQGDILILDEPTANIDNKTEEHLFDLLEEFSEEKTILVVTHDIGVAASLFKRIACVNQQVVIHPTSQLTGDLIREMYVGNPQFIHHDHRCTIDHNSHD